MIEPIRAFVRPLVTVSFTWAFILACLYGNWNAAQLLGVPMTAAVAWWFSDRGRNNNG